ncbi:MAG: Gfo/Idh/MocA family oxidoreductase [Eubacteriales bacterium]|nr:Gfo/Idh/MocA family oxidoreductase [Eubacteriales bacterium]
MSSPKRIGVIGCGQRGCMILDNMLRVGGDRVVFAAYTDQFPDYAHAQMDKYPVIDRSKAVFYPTPEEMLAKADLDGVIVAVRCSRHTELALKVIDAGLPLFLEKPIATTLDDYYRLRHAAARRRRPVVVSFPLRLTEACRVVKEIVDSGEIGQISQVQGYNNVYYGGVYYHSWYRDENETHGLWLQKATHDFDYINFILGKQPVEVCAMSSKTVFRGNKPAGLKCADCAEKDTCPEGPNAMDHIKHDDPRGDMCCFAVDTGNQDSGTAICRYADGMHMVYTQNFVARKTAGKRGARFIGYDGTVEFDWNTDTINVYMHNGQPDRTIKLDTAALSHGGGDDRLCEDFIQIMYGKDFSVSPLEAGLDSVLLCLKAKESCLTHKFEDLTEA